MDNHTVPDLACTIHVRAIWGGSHMLNPLSDKPFLEFAFSEFTSTVCMQDLNRAGELFLGPALEGLENRLYISLVKQEVNKFIPRFCTNEEGKIAMAPKITFLHWATDIRMDDLEYSLSLPCGNARNLFSLA